MNCGGRRARRPDSVRRQRDDRHAGPRATGGPRARSASFPGLSRGHYALVTLHRPSNVDGADCLERLVKFLERMARRRPTLFPAHPRTRASLERFGLLPRVLGCGGLTLLDPLGLSRKPRPHGRCRRGDHGLRWNAGRNHVPRRALPHRSGQAPSGRSRSTEGTNTIVGDDSIRAEELGERRPSRALKTGNVVEGWDGRAAERVVDALVSVGRREAGTWRRQGNGELRTTKMCDSEDREGRASWVSAMWDCPSRVEFVRAGFPVLGFDLDTAKVRALLAGQSYISHIPADRIRTASQRESSTRRPTRSASPKPTPSWSAFPRR